MEGLSDGTMESLEPFLPRRCILLGAPKSAVGFDVSMIERIEAMMMRVVVVRSGVGWKRELEA